MMMIDFVKAITTDQQLIKKLRDFGITNFQERKAQNSNYVCYGNSTGRMRLEFRKTVLENEYRHLELCFSPHYLFNDDLHNGNDLTPKNCIKTIAWVLSKIGITASDLQEFVISNLEFGLNLSVHNATEIVDGLLFTKRTPFTTKEIPTFKKSDLSRFKEIKAYDKSAQFPELFNNVFRFEVRIKRAMKIKSLGISTLADLTKLEKYSVLFQSIVDEWEQVLIINKNLKTKENTAKFWNEIILNNYRNKYPRARANYYKSLPKKDSFYHQILCKIIDKITELQSGANCHRQTTINKGKITFV